MADTEGHVSGRQNAIDAAAEALHKPCICGSDASHEEQMAWATQTATTALDAAERVCPHDPPKRDPASTTTCGTTIRHHPGPAHRVRDRRRAITQGGNPMTTTEPAVLPDEVLGLLVRSVWVQWAGEQPSLKPSWLVPWDDLDDGQREVDIRIGRAVAARGWRVGVLHAIARLDRLAEATGSHDALVLHRAAAALREELKIAEENAA